MSSPRGFEVAEVTGATLVQDLGRPGWSAVGLGRSGAADRAAHALANRLLGNAEDAATLEVVGQLVLEGVGAITWVVVTGGRGPVLLDGQLVGDHAPVAVPPGAHLEVGPATQGLRRYVGVRGGVAVAPVLGSRSRDVLAEVGPPPPRRGDLLPVGAAPATPLRVDQATPQTVADSPLRVVAGPRADWVHDVHALVGTAWTVGEQSNRVGVRLRSAGGSPPPGLARVDPGRELPSEGLWRGAVQVPPSGEPVVFLADHPVTGGYPVVGVVVDADVDRVAQLRPGDPLRLRWA
ncbi:MAG: 5-oxoprolinase/urea amidolyase family protein [Nocardioides sp.]|nr:5-oxoprolinase/urea amidolyase family protein [Nocardioides sp.]